MYDAQTSYVSDMCSCGEKRTYISRVLIKSPTHVLQITLCTVEQWWQKAYTLNTQFEHRLLCPLLRSILNMYLHTPQKCWEQWLDDLDNKQDVQGVMVKKWINQYKWPTYYSCHYCIDAMKQYTCLAKIQITLYCNMANWSLFARYVLYHHKYYNWSLMLFGCFWHLKLQCMITKACYIKAILYSR